MEIFSKITQSFKNQSFMKTIGAQLDLIDYGKVIISVKLKQNMMQQHGFGHAGITFSIGDSAAGYAALTKMEENQEVLTSEMKIHLLSPADGKILKTDDGSIWRVDSLDMYDSQYWSTPYPVVIDTYKSYIINLEESKRIKMAKKKVPLH